MRVLATILLASLAVADTIPNGLTGDPVVSCGDSAISVEFTTKEAFLGTAYVKGFFTKDRCRTRGPSANASVTMQVPLNFECGIRRKRVISPKRGLMLETVIVLMFHPIFLTKTDRSFRLQCFYMEADQAVSQSLSVSTLPPTDLKSQDDMPMPVCQYEVLKGGPAGAAVTVASIGEQIYHKWSCGGPQKDVYCMTVHSCTADDGQGLGQLLLDENGCSMDSFLLADLQYVDDTTAGQTTSVFKFADHQTIFFGCQIRLELKAENGGKCERPTCSKESSGTREVSVPQRSATNDGFPKPFDDMAIVDFESTPKNDDDGLSYAEAEFPTYQPYARKRRNLHRQLKFPINVDVVTSVEALDDPNMTLLDPQGVERKRIHRTMKQSTEVCVSRMMMTWIFVVLAFLSSSLVVFVCWLQRQTRRRRKLRNFR